MVEEGETVTDVPLNEPGIQVYVVPPLAVNVVEAPTQIVFGDALAEIVGSGFTVTVTFAVFEQPDPLVPVTVYVCVELGETETEVPLNDPGIQV